MFLTYLLRWAQASCSQILPTRWGVLARLSGHTQASGLLLQTNDAWSAWTGWRPR